MERLERERPRLESELAAGRQLLQDERTPDFVQQAVTVLEDTMRETESLATIKYQTLRVGTLAIIFLISWNIILTTFHFDWLMQENLECWEEYEATKTKINETLRKAENEANRQSTPGGQESVQKELAAKVNAQQTMHELQPDVNRLKDLSGALSDMASERRQANLADDMNEVETRVDRLNSKLNDRVNTLSEADQHWTGLYEGINSFGDWLSEKERQLQEVAQSNATPDEQYRQAKVSTWPSFTMYCSHLMVTSLLFLSSSLLLRSLTTRTSSMVTNRKRQTSPRGTAPGRPLLSNPR